jgi:hypothetical protein
MKKPLDDCENGYGNCETAVESRPANPEAHPIPQGE